MYVYNHVRVHVYCRQLRHGAVFVHVRVYIVPTRFIPSKSISTVGNSCVLLETVALDSRQLRFIGNSCVLLETHHGDHFLVMITVYTCTSVQSVLILLLWRRW